jgi:hypothetical protein
MKSVILFTLTMGRNGLEMPPLWASAEKLLLETGSGFDVLDPHGRIPLESLD